MTTIVAVETPNGVIIGADSQSTYGMQKAAGESGKITTRGAYTLAVAGRGRLAQALRHAKLPDVKLEDIDEHVSEVFAPALAQISVADGCEPDEFMVIVAIKGRVYQVFGDGSYLRNRTGLYSIGSGSSFAIGALSNLGRTPTVRDVERALEIAASHDIGTSGPFKVSIVK